MNLPRLRKLVEALPISAAERDAILDCLIPTKRVHAEAYKQRAAMEARGIDRVEAIRTAIQHFKLQVDNVDGLRKAVRDPNGTIRALAKEIPDSESDIRSTDENPI
jgi:hypothetical protein